MSDIKNLYNRVVSDNDQSWAHLAKISQELERLIAKHRTSQDVEMQLLVAAARMTVGEIKLRELRQALIESNRIDG